MTNLCEMKNLDVLIRKLEISSTHNVVYTTRNERIFHARISSSNWKLKRVIRSWYNRISERFRSKIAGFSGSTRRSHGERDRSEGMALLHGILINVNYLAGTAPHFPPDAEFNFPASFHLAGPLNLLPCTTTTLYVLTTLLLQEEDSLIDKYGVEREQPLPFFDRTSSSPLCGTRADRVDFSNNFFFRQRE